MIRQPGFLDVEGRLRELSVSNEACARPVDEGDVPLFADGGAHCPPEMIHKATTRDVTATATTSAPAKSDR
jgi:hypothetical protein